MIRPMSTTQQQSSRIARLQQQRDELLVALKMALPMVEAEHFKQAGSYGRNYVETKSDRAREAYTTAKSVISKVESEKI